MLPNLWAWLEKCYKNMEKNNKAYNLKRWLDLWNRLGVESNYRRRWFK